MLRDVEVDRSELYVTNAVKHFKWEPRGKRRLHKRPNQQEVHACGSWLERRDREGRAARDRCAGSDGDSRGYRARVQRRRCAAITAASLEWRDGDRDLSPVSDSARR